jgi:glutamine synthetase
MPIIAEYVWLDADKTFRSKTRVLSNILTNTKEGANNLPPLTSIPNWNYDGSSTKQASTGSSEITLIPCFSCWHPFFTNTDKSVIEAAILVLCESYTSDGKPAIGNTRYYAKAVFDTDKESEPWFGFEQEYFLSCTPLINESFGSYLDNRGKSYCGVGKWNIYGREVAEKHMLACLTAGLTISGINAEVAPGQWEFQIGPICGIEAADQLIIARFILERICEKEDLDVNWLPKPFDKVNGSGCHTNYSTKATREGTAKANGITIITEHLRHLEKHHIQHMKAYGDGNELRMTGTNETARYDVFSSGIGDRGASIRVGNDVHKSGYGYYEDRRPASNCDPYIVSSMIFNTTVVEPMKKNIGESTVSSLIDIQVHI